MLCPPIGWTPLHNRSGRPDRTTKATDPSGGEGTGNLEHAPVASPHEPVQVSFQHLE
jgi:hypothetical protein